MTGKYTLLLAFMDLFNLYRNVLFRFALCAAARKDSDLCAFDEIRKSALIILENLRELFNMD